MKEEETSMPDILGFLFDGECNWILWFLYIILGCFLGVEWEAKGEIDFCTL